MRDRVGDEGECAIVLRHGRGAPSSQERAGGSLGEPANSIRYCRREFRRSIEGVKSRRIRAPRLLLAR